jgi:hypothetical protein
MFRGQSTSERTVVVLDEDAPHGGSTGYAYPAGGTVALQETPKFSWAGLFSSADPRKYNVIFVGKSDR